jgi:DNA-binding transcriptional regulator LsrR (DeoR family)
MWNDGCIHGDLVGSHRSENEGKQPMVNQDLRQALLARIASMYYDQNKTQQEIAEITGANRTAISRMLAEARQQGVVDIVVKYPWCSAHLEEALVSRFNLKAARVMVTEHESNDEMLRGLGVLAAAYFNQILQDNMVVGISWGSALYQMIQALPPANRNAVEVVQLIGATGSENILTDGPILAQLLAAYLKSPCRYVHAPLVVESQVVRDSLLQVHSIRDTLNRAADANIALVGIGSLDPDLYSLKRAGYISEPERQEIENTGVVGDICGHHYRIDGECPDISINQRVIAVDLKTLSNIPNVIAVAGGGRKGPAILGALRGGFVDVLITDAAAAEYLLQH